MARAGIKAASSRRWWTHAWSQAAALIAIATVVYLPALRGGFIWDDRMYLTQGAEAFGQSVADSPWFVENKLRRRVRPAQEQAGKFKAMR